MIKTLRFIAVAALMTVCGGNICAQNADENPKTETLFKFVDVYDGIEGENGNKTAIYLEKHEITKEGFKITFKKGGAKEAPNYNIAGKYIKLLGGEVGTTTDGNTMTYTADNYITQINLVATNAKPWGEIKVNVGTITLTGSNDPKRNVTWLNKDAEGNTIDTKEVIFTICSSSSPSNSDHVRYTQTKVITVQNAPTGITSVTTDTAKNGARYNLAGQRVNDSYKGVVIENGKKKIVK